MEFENTNIEMEQTADQQDAFLDGWGDETPEAEQTADQSVEQAEDEVTESAEATEAQEATTADGEAKTEEQPKTEGNTTEQAAPEAPSWKLKHMGEEKTLGVGDITTELLQKGMDYDRVRGKYDEAKPVMEMFGEFAKAAGMSVADYVKFIRAEAKRAKGMSEADAKREVELEDREAAVSAKEAAQQKQTEEKETVNEKVRQDLDAFAKAFPDVYAKARTDTTVIPQEVWDVVHSGQQTLTAAYARYAVAEAQRAAQEAKATAAAAGQNAKNAVRSTGSMVSAGNDKKVTDAFLDGWNS